MTKHMFVTHPWVAQLSDDLELVLTRPEFSDFSYDWESRSIRELYHDEYIRECLCSLDLTIIYSASCRYEWIPPNTALATTLPPENDSELCGRARRHLSSVPYAITRAHHVGPGS